MTDIAIEPDTLVPAARIQLRHMACARCGKHVAATVFLGDNDRVIDSWGGILFDSPGFVCDCCVKECPTCRGGAE